MDSDKLKNLNANQIKAVENVYGSLIEYLDLIHPSKIGPMNRHFYSTTEEESEFGLDRNWHIFLELVTAGSFRDKDLYMQVESDYNETLKIVAQVKDMKKSKKTDSRLQDRAWDLLDSLLKIRLLLSGEWVKHKPAVNK